MATATAAKRTRGRAAAIVLAGLLAAGGVTAAAAAAALIGGPAPDFALKSRGGANLRLSEELGNVVMVNFWATWCGPCRQEMPLLDEIYDRYRDAGFQLLGVNIDDDANKAARMADDMGVGFPLLFDQEKEVSRLYDVSAMPVTVLIDRDGTVRHVHHGYRPGYEDAYIEQVRALLRED
jgi:peroxiredoxin